MIDTSSFKKGDKLTVVDGRQFVFDSFMPSTGGKFLYAWDLDNREMKLLDVRHITTKENGVVHSFQFKKGSEITSTHDDFYHDLVNGFIDPDKLLDSGFQAAKVKQAMMVLEEFFDQAISSGALKEEY